MASESDQLHIMFFPLMAQGHMLPTMDMAKLFAARGGVKATIVTTPLNAPVFFKAIKRSRNSSVDITIKVLKFPAEEAGLPEGFESLHQVTSDETFTKFFTATSLLQQPLEQLLQECRPHALIADMLFPWTTDLAAKFRIPRLVFYVSSLFSLCITESLYKHKPHEHVKSDAEQFIVPGLAHQIKLTRVQVPDQMKVGLETEITRLYERVEESYHTSYGVILNSFYELEPAYADQYMQGRKLWHVGPVWLCNIRDDAEEATIDRHDCFKWLDSKEPNSVVYVGFGSLVRFGDSQLMEIAMGLEASGQQFIWTMMKEKDEDQEEEGSDEEWLPKGFEERMKGKGLIIRGWAPQQLILGHKAVGGFMFHCGWNSLLEGVNAGVAMVTWPVFAEQFFNEKLVTEVLKIGVGVGAQQCVAFTEQYRVNWDAIEKAVRGIMVGEEAEEMRSRARAVGEMGRAAIEEGGSSCNDLNVLIEELRSYRRLQSSSDQL